MTIVGALFTVAGVPALHGALCRGHACMFDPAEQDEPADVVAERHRQALALCGRCPALEPCGAWLDALAPSKRPQGIVAGRVVSPRRRQ